MSRPPLRDALGVAAFLSAELTAAGIECAITGAIELAAHGVPRMTKDADLAVYCAAEDPAPLLDTLERAGWFWVRCGAVDVDLFVALSALQREALARRVELDVAGHGRRWFHSAEDLAITKLALLRHKDLADLELLFAAQGPRLDVAYVRRWLETITAENDERRRVLDDLERRFVRVSADPA